MMCSCEENHESCGGARYNQKISTACTVPTLQTASLMSYQQTAPYRRFVDVISKDNKGAHRTDTSDHFVDVDQKTGTACTIPTLESSWCQVQILEGQHGSDIQPHRRRASMLVSPTVDSVHPCSLNIGWILSICLCV